MKILKLIFASALISNFAQAQEDTMLATEEPVTLKPLASVQAKLKDSLIPQTWDEIWKESRPVAYGFLAQALATIFNDSVDALCPDCTALQVFTANTGTDFVNRMIRNARKLTETIPNVIQLFHSENPSNFETTLNKIVNYSFYYGKNFIIPAVLYGAGVTGVYKLSTYLMPERVAFFMSVVGSSLVQFMLDSDFHLEDIQKKIAEHQN